MPNLFKSIEKSVQVRKWQMFQVRGLDRASRCAEIADRALIALLKIVAECRRCDEVKAYSVHPRILARLAPGESYSVALGFG